MSGASSLAASASIGPPRNPSPYTPIIEVAKDLKTARALWLSPGLLNRRDDSGKLYARRGWAKYAADFIKEDGEWKFWHLHVDPTFRTPFDKGWVESPVVGSFSPPKGVRAG